MSAASGLFCKSRDSEHAESLQGLDAYNPTLSEERAGAVRQLLVAVCDIDPRHVDAFGERKKALKDDAYPEDAVNRRVEIRNLTP